MIVFLLSCRLQPLSPSWKDDFMQIHQNVYEVYKAQRNGRNVHQILQKSFSGEALTQEYIEHYSTLAKMESEETAIDIKQIDYHSVKVLEYTKVNLRVDADWSVGGIVTHQKHNQEIHVRA